jgi:hypothetical protein
LNKHAQNYIAGASCSNALHYQLPRHFETNPVERITLIFFFQQATVKSSVMSKMAVLKANPEGTKPGLK